LIVIVSGTRIEYLNNPLGGFINFDTLRYNFTLFGAGLSITPLADFITLIWIVGIINVINFLDGLDGLAAGVSFFSAVSIFFVSLLLTVYQPATALLSAILAGSLLGFLPFNFNPAKIFMGDSGSHFLGFALAILAIISGAKMATAFLVLGFPILDGLLVVCKRVIRGGSPFQADKSHLHHRLLDIGLSTRAAVIFIWLLTIAFGLVDILSTTYGKMLSAILLIVVMIFLSLLMTYFEGRKNVQKSN
jgi:UDP-GlcNAc:undecaprenyl-phosphate GlcNAc-1-phosphate transferase